MPAAGSAFKVLSTCRSVSPSLRFRAMSSAVWSNSPCRSEISLSNFFFARSLAAAMRLSATASASARRPSKSAIFSRSFCFFDFSKERTV